MIPFNLMKSTYEKHRHLHNAADELGMKWQTLYWHLRKNNIQVTGDKAKYGSREDKLAAKSEEYFNSLVPYAKNLNLDNFQSECDFDVNGLKVDVKASNLHKSNHNSKSMRWNFSIKRQSLIADFIVCIGYKEHNPYIHLLLPYEIVKGRQTISVSEKRGKWFDYLVQPEELKEFFDFYCEIKEESF